MYLHSENIMRNFQVAQTLVTLKEVCAFITPIREKELLMPDVLPSPVLPKYLAPIVEFAVPLSIDRIIRLAFRQ